METNEADVGNPSGSPKGLSGSNAERVLLLPVQNDAASERALQWYAESFRRPGDELLFLVVVEPTLRMRKFKMEGVSTNDPLVEAAMMGGRNVVRRFLQRARELNVRCRGTVQLDISPGLSIVRTARERGVHAILLTSRARVTGESERPEFDSATEHVLRNCPSVALIIVPLSRGDRRMRRHSFYKQFIDNLF